MKCKYCDSQTNNKKSGICSECMSKIYQIRQIKSMLMPYYLRKKEREKKNGN